MAPDLGTEARQARRYNPCCSHSFSKRGSCPCVMSSYPSSMAEPPWLSTAMLPVCWRGPSNVRGGHATRLWAAGAGQGHWQGLSHPACGGYPGLTAHQSLSISACPRCGALRSNGVRLVAPGRDAGRQDPVPVEPKLGGHEAVPLLLQLKFDPCVLCMCRHPGHRSRRTFKCPLLSGVNGLAQHLHLASSAPAISVPTTCQQFAQCPTLQPWGGHGSSRASADPSIIHQP